MAELSPYGLAADFERSVVYLMADSAVFYGRVGCEVDPERLGAPAAALLARACRAIGTDSGGNGPGSITVAVQRLARWKAEGRVTSAQIADVGALLDFDPPELESVALELAPILRRAAEKDALLAGLDTFGKRGDLSKTAEQLAAAQRIGLSDSSLGLSPSPSMFGKGIQPANVTRRATGIGPVDRLTDGGLAIGCLGVVMASSGGGKSMALAHIAAQGLAERELVCFATLELPPAVQLCRILAGLLDIEVDDLIFGSVRADIASRRLTNLALRAGGDGKLALKGFTAGATQVSEITAWVKQVEATYSRRCTLLVVDYADKMTGAKRKDESSYAAMGDVYEGLRLWAEGRGDARCWTASQPRRGASKDKKTLDGDDVADSLNKLRVSDLFITAVRTLEEPAEVDWAVVKDRHGSTVGRKSGSVPVDWAFGRASPDRPLRYDAQDRPL